MGGVPWTLLKPGYSIKAMKALGGVIYEADVTNKFGISVTV